MVLRNLKYRRYINIKRIILVFILTIVCLVIVYNNASEKNFNLRKSFDFFKNFQSKINDQPNSYIRKSYKNLNDSKVIFFEQQDYYFGFGYEPFIKNKCPVSNCFVTNNITLLGKNTIEKADAVIFHMMNKFKFPHNRNAHQRYIMYLLESPMLDNYDYNKAKNKFNWTMTYRTDSDITLSYGHFKPLNLPFIYPPSIAHPLQWKNYDAKAFKDSLPSRSREFKNIAKKEKLVAWIVSNCNPTSERKKYVDMLKNYVPVEIMGRCGGKSKPCKNREKFPYDECSQYIHKEFKFYLSFENSFCNDYITEKFKTRAMFDVVPIVMGAGNYSRIAPPHSHINIMDYDSPKDLAEYLLKLDKDPEEYLSYFWWKDYYKVDRDLNAAFCELCAKLNDPTEPPKSYYNLNFWWRETSHCIGRGQYPWSSGNMNIFKELMPKFRSKVKHYFTDKTS